MTTAFPAGFLLSLSLILAIGAQNAFVLRQGLRQAHIGAVVAICITSEAVLIFSGVAGFGLIVDAAPWVLDAIRWGGAAFLVFYAGQSLYSAYTSTNALTDSPAGAGSLRAAVMAALILTWANPHVYLDTFGLIGAVAAQYGPGRWWFGTGAFTASTVFFLTLGYGARGLAPIFRRPGAWRVLDGIVGFTMLGLAIKLVFLA